MPEKRLHARFYEIQVWNAHGQEYKLVFSFSFFEFLMPDRRQFVFFIPCFFNNPDSFIKCHWQTIAQKQIQYCLNLMSKTTIYTLTERFINYWNKFLDKTKLFFHILPILIWCIDLDLQSARLVFEYVKHKRIIYLILLKSRNRNNRVRLRVCNLWNRKKLENPGIRSLVSMSKGPINVNFSTLLSYLACFDSDYHNSFNMSN